MQNDLPYLPFEACTSMADIRQAIDTLDRQVVRLLGERYGYVKAAAAFKTSATAVQAPERVAAMLQQRRLWAQEAGLNPDAIEKLFADLVAHFINEEMQRWRAQAEGQSPGDTART
jgi:isochorismate pyruvate lyase